MTGGEIFAGIVLDLAKGAVWEGAKRILKQAPVLAAIESTAKQYPECEPLEYLLRRWYESEEFDQLLEELKKPGCTLSNKDVISSFIEVSEFDAGDETEAEARKILSTFKMNLLYALLSTDEGLMYLFHNEQALHQISHEKLEQISRGVDELKKEVRKILDQQAVEGKLEILPVNRRGHNIFTMSYPGREFYVHLDFYTKSNVPAEILSLELRYGQGNMGLAQEVLVEGARVTLDDYTILSQPIALQPGVARRVNLARMFSPNLPVNFDDSDAEKFDEIRESLDYGDVMIIAGINFKQTPGTAERIFRFRLEAMGRLIPSEPETDKAKGSR